MQSRLNLKELSAARLDSLAIERYQCYRHATGTIRIDSELPGKAELDALGGPPSLNAVLRERQWRLNDAFAFTPESAARFAHISDRLSACLAKAWAEARPIREALEKRIRDGDPFLTDYEIELKIAPFLKRQKPPAPPATTEEPKTIIQDVLENILHDSLVDLNMNARRDDPDHIYLSRELNWNAADTLRRHETALADYYIGYAMHVLCDHAHWSLSDILNIDRIWTDVVVTRQNEWTEQNT